MPRQFDIAQFTSIKERSHGSDEMFSVAYKTDQLLKKISEISDRQTAAQYATVTIFTHFEIFIRGFIEELVNGDPRCAIGAKKIAKDTKFNLDDVFAISAKNFTRGSLVAHLVATSTLESVLSTFNTLLGTNLLAELSAWALKSKDKECQQICDTDEVARVLTRLYECRHIFVHEMPDKPPCDLDEAMQFIHIADGLMQAGMGYCVDKLVIPMTQGELNLHAAEQLEKSLEELKATIAIVTEHMDDEALQDFNEVQSKWDEYVDAEARLHRHKGSASSMEEAFIRNQLTFFRRETLVLFLPQDFLDQD